NKSISVVEDDSSDSDQGGMDDVDGGIDSLPPPIHESIKEALGKGKREKETKPPEAPEGPSLMEEMMREAEEERKKKEQIERKKEAKRAKKFGGGLKGGFFGAKKKKGSKKKPPSSSSSSSSTSKNTSPSSSEVYELSPTGDMIPTLTSRPPSSKSSDPLVLDEVQRALGSDPASMLNQSASQWATPSLTSKIMSNPRLAMGMSNPRFLQAIEDMKRDPEGAKRKYKGKKEIEDFIKEFMGVMGQHFTEMGEQEAKGKGEGQQQQQQQQQQQRQRQQQQGPALGPLAKEALERQAAREARGEVGWDDSSASKAAVDAIVGDSEISAVLMDPEMQRVLQECAKPGRMGKYMQDGKWGPKIRMLIDKGLIKVEK
ncbi:hypothetical protein TrRE_jg13192, partial [Triparma retinervis]